jgi:hypothetical protein
VVGIVDGVVDAGRGEEAAAVGFDGLVGEEEDGLVGVPVLVEVPVLLGLEQEQLHLLLHSFI